MVETTPYLLLAPFHFLFLGAHALGAEPLCEEGLPCWGATRRGPQDHKEGPRDHREREGTSGGPPSSHPRQDTRLAGEAFSNPPDKLSDQLNATRDLSQ